MTHTDPTELTPPDGHSLLPPNATHNEIVGAINRQSSIQHKTFDVVQAIHLGMVTKGLCPHPEQRCAALEMSGTASIGVAELHGMRRRDNRVMVLVGILVGGCLSLAGGWMTRSTTEAAAAVAAKVAVDAAKDEVRKSQKSTAEISFASAREGAKIGWNEARAEMNPAPLVVTK
jgi:hypothetical protein